MQIHGPSETPKGISVRLNPGSGQPFAILDFGSTEIYLQSVADADELIRAAVDAKRLLLGESIPVRKALDPERDDWDGDELASRHAGTDAS